MINLKVLDTNLIQLFNIDADAYRVINNLNIKYYVEHLMEKG